MNHPVFFNSDGRTVDFMHFQWKAEFMARKTNEKLGKTTKCKEQIRKNTKKLGKTRKKLGKTKEKLRKTTKFKEKIRKNT